MIGDLVGSKMIVLAIIGLVAIGGVNFVFFKVLKGELKKRKLIWLKDICSPFIFTLNISYQNNLNEAIKK